MISILVPYRPDGAHRDNLWTYCQQQWATTPYEIVEGHESGAGPFNASQAFNNAASKASGNVFVTFGADHLPNMPAIDNAAHRATVHGWAPVFTETREYSPEDTYAILHGANPYDLPTHQTAPFCIAIIAVTREAWIPFDERFNGWGSEDAAWRLALEGIHGEPQPTPAQALHALWHPPAPRTHAEHNHQLLREYVDALNARRMRQHLTRVGVL